MIAGDEMGWSYLRYCPWCSTITAQAKCPGCGHRSDRPRGQCDCVLCAGRRQEDRILAEKRPRWLARPGEGR